MFMNLRSALTVDSIFYKLPHAVAPCVISITGPRVAVAKFP